MYDKHAEINLLNHQALFNVEVDEIFISYFQFIWEKSIHNMLNKCKRIRSLDVSTVSLFEYNLFFINFDVLTKRKKN